jgi:hypothetical protein
MPIETYKCLIYGLQIRITRCIVIGRLSKQQQAIRRGHSLRDGPFDFSWGGAQIRKKISNMSRIEEKKIEHQHHQKKYRAQKISKLAILYIERKMLQPDFWF